jgi:hypothetical protein
MTGSAGSGLFRGRYDEDCHFAKNALRRADFAVAEFEQALLEFENVISLHGQVGQGTDRGKRRIW